MRPLSRRYGRTLVLALAGAATVSTLGVACSTPPRGQATSASSLRPPVSREEVIAGAPTLAPSTTTTTTMAADLTIPTVAPASRPPVDPGSLPPVVLASTGVPLSVVAPAGSGYLVTTPCQEQRFVAGATPVRFADVVIDPGHGGAIEDGAVGPRGLKEKDLNLAVATYLRADLEHAGLHPLLTRSGDYPMTVEARARIVGQLRPRAFVSIHHNAEPEVASNVPGTEAYYQLSSPESKRLSGLIWDEVTRALARYPSSWVARRDAGVKLRVGDHGDDYYGILRETHGTPATLAELAYISDPSEEALLARRDVQEAEAAAVARGIVRFLETPDPGSGYVDAIVRTEPAGAGGMRSPACVDPALN